MPSGTRSSCSGRCRPWPASPWFPSPSSTGAASRASAPPGSWPPWAAVHPLLVWYSQDARSYSLALLFGSLGWLAFLRLLDEPRPPYVLWWGLVSSAAAVTHYTTVYFVIAQGVWLLVTRPRIRGPMLLAGGGLALIGLALGPQAATVDDARTGWIRFIPLGDRLEAAVRDGLAGPLSTTWHPTFVVAVLAALAALPVLWRA